MRCISHNLGINSNKGGPNTPYINDGLIAMWDGEWNVGLNQHDATSLVWKDITGNNYDWELTSNECWESDKILMNKTIGAMSEFNSAQLFNSKQKFFEFVGRFTSGGYNNERHIVYSNYSKYTILTNWGRAFNFAGYGDGTYPINASVQWQSGNFGSVTGIVRCFKGDDSVLYGWDISTLNLVATITEEGYPIYGSGGTQQKPFDNTTHLFTNNGTTCTGAGYLNCFRIYDRMLTTEEISHNQAIDKERFNLPI